MVSSKFHALHYRDDIKFKFLCRILKRKSHNLFLYVAQFESLSCEKSRKKVMDFWEIYRRLLQIFLIFYSHAIQEFSLRMTGGDENF